VRPGQGHGGCPVPRGPSAPGGSEI